MISLPIAYATDDGYAQHVAVSLYSLFCSSKEPEKLDVYILANNLSPRHRNKLVETAKKFNKGITFIDISDIKSRLPEGIDTANLSISTYCRLFVGQLMPDNLDRLLYLDCDTYLNDDIAEILQFIPQDDDWFIAGVEDTMYPHMKEGIGLKRENLYLNAGILMINLRKWRQDNVVDQFLRFIKRFNGAVPHLDQGVLNGVFRRGKVRIPLRFNVQAPIFAIHERKNILKFFNLTDFYSDNEIAEAKENPAIIHYTSFFLERPWFRFSLHPYKKLYRDTLKLTGYSDAILQKNQIGIVGKFKDMVFRYLQPIYLKLR